MVHTNYIIKIESENDISLPKNGVALLTALDKALESNSFEIIYKDGYDAKIVIPPQDNGKFSTFILFELNGNADFQEVVEQIKEQVSYACSPEIVEATPEYQLIRIDSCPVNFRM